MYTYTLYEIAIEKTYRPMHTYIVTNIQTNTLPKRIHTHTHTVYEIAIEKTCKRLDARTLSRGSAVTIILSSLTVCSFGPLIAIYGVPTLWET